MNISSLFLLWSNISKTIVLEPTHILYGLFMIEAIPYQESFARRWDDFVENAARNGTFLHTRKFFRQNPINREIDSSLMFVKKANIIGVLPAVLQKVKERLVWNSHAYSTYGGFVVSDKLGVEEALEIVDLSVKYAAEKGVNEIIIRNPFRIFNKVPNDETDYAMWFKGFRILRRDVEIALPLNGYNQQTIDALYDGKTRNAVRKAEKENIVVEMTVDFDKFWQILSLNLSEKHAAKPTHSLEQFQVLYDLMGTEKIKFFGAYLDGTLIAGIVIFVANRKAIHAQYIAGLQKFQHLRPINLLIHKIAVWAVANKFQYFNLGMVNNPDGSGVNSGLCKFKEGFGGSSVLRETMHLVLD